MGIGGVYALGQYHKHPRAATLLLRDCDLCAIVIWCAQSLADASLHYEVAL